MLAQVYIIDTSSKLRTSSPFPKTHILVRRTWLVLIHNTVFWRLVALGRDLKKNGFGYARKICRVTLPADVVSIRGEQQARLARREHDLGGVIVRQGNHPESLEENHPSVAIGVSINACTPYSLQETEMGRGFTY